uniref:Transposase n=1 Tax=Steinernema glaseri TaxID=37863 RepID=A0A1I8AFL4_9BILA
MMDFAPICFEDPILNRLYRSWRKLNPNE